MENNFRIIINSNEYLNSNNFETEKKYDYARYFIKTNFLADFLPKYKKLRDIENSYNSSFLNAIKEMITNKSFYSEKDKEMIDKNTAMVEIKILKNNKEKTFKELKINDNLLKYFDTKLTLENYLECFIEYKRLRDRGKQKFFILESGKEYSSDKEFRNIKMLTETTRNASILFCSVNDYDILDKVHSWSKFIRKNIPIKKHYYEYDIVTKEIETLPEFNESELNYINLQNEYFSNKISQFPKLSQNSAEK